MRNLTLGTAAAVALVVSGCAELIGADYGDFTLDSTGPAAGGAAGNPGGQGGQGGPGGQGGAAGQGGQGGAATGGEGGQALRANGAACDDGAECASGICTAEDGVCCDAICDGPCRGCLASNNDGAGGDGTCGAAPTGTVCRPSRGSCDLEETCDAGACPADALVTGTCDVAGGAAHSCVVRSGSVLCWGKNDSGQLGDASVVESHQPVPTLNITNALSVAAGEDHTCALISDGSVSCWGEGTSGQLGDGSPQMSSVPVAVSGISDAIAIDLGFDHSCALHADGTVSCWGDNAMGQLGSPGGNASVPRLVPGLTDVVDIAAGARHSCTAHADGTARCWGENTYGGLGDGTFVQRNAPVSVSGITGSVQRIGAGFGHTCAIFATGSMMCWGFNGSGQLGAGMSGGSSEVPVAVSGIIDATEVDGGADHTCVLLATGAVNCWGFGVLGQLGHGAFSSSNVPVSVAGAVDAIAVATGNVHSLMVLESFQARTWGLNNNGQLGNDTTTNSDLPVQPIGL